MISSTFSTLPGSDQKIPVLGFIKLVYYQRKTKTLKFKNTRPRFHFVSGVNDNKHRYKISNCQKNFRYATDA